MFPSAGAKVSLLPTFCRLSWAAKPLRAVNLQWRQSKARKRVQQPSRTIKQEEKKFDANKTWNGSDELELQSSASDEEQEFQVEAILKKKIVNNQIYYKIKWLYYPDKEWLREEHLTGCKDLLQEFNSTQ